MNRAVLSVLLVVVVARVLAEVSPTVDRMLPMNDGITTLLLLVLSFLVYQAWPSARSS